MLVTGFFNLIAVQPNQNVLSWIYLLLVNTKWTVLASKKILNVQFSDALSLPKTSILDMKPEGKRERKRKMFQEKRRLKIRTSRWTVKEEPPK